MPVTLVLLLTMLGGASDAPAPAFVWEPVPGTIEAVSAGAPIDAAGYPVRVQAVRSSRTFEELLAHFARSFVKAGLYVAPFEKQSQGFRPVRLTGLDTHTLVAYTVFFQLNTDKTTTVVMTEAALGERRRAPSAENDGAPVFPGAASPLRSRFEASRSLLYSVDGASPDEVYAFYLEVLSGAGYTEGPVGTFGGHGEQLEVIVRRAGPGVSVMVLTRPTPAEPPR